MSDRNESNEDPQEQQGKQREKEQAPGVRAASDAGPDRAVGQGGRDNQGGGTNPGADAHRPGTVGRHDDDPRHTAAAPASGYHRGTDYRGMGRGGGGGRSGTQQEGGAGTGGGTGPNRGGPISARGGNPNRGGTTASEQSGAVDEGEQEEMIVCCDECEWEMTGVDREELAGEYQSHMADEHSRVVPIGRCRQQVEPYL